MTVVLIVRKIQIEGKGGGEMDKKRRDRRDEGTSGFAFINVMRMKNRERKNVGRMEVEGERRMELDDIDQKERWRGILVWKSRRHKNKEEPRCREQKCG